MIHLDQSLSMQYRDDEIQSVIESYLQARKRLLELGREVPERIGGNDNIIGRIGEFIGLRFLESLGHRPQKAEGASNPGYDLIEGDCLTQVKAITHENQRGRSVRLTPGWTQLLLIELGEHYQPERIGCITLAQHRQAIAAGFARTGTPLVRLSMLGSGGLIGRFGRVYGRKEIETLGI